MAQDNDGSDLSDLKQRLGLDKSETSDSEGDDQPDESKEDQQARYDAESQPSNQASGGDRAAGSGSGIAPDAETRVTPTPGSAGQGGQSRQGGGSQQEPAAGPPGAAGPPSGGGPPSGSSGPPGAGGPPGGGSGGSSGPSGGDQFDESMAPSSRGSATTSEMDGGSFGAEPEEDIDLDEDLDFGDSTFSGAVLGLIVAALIVGVVFGLVGMSSYKTRQMYQARTDQAKQVLEAVRPKAEAFQKAHKIITGLNPEKVAYDKVKKLGKLNVGVDMSAVDSNKLLLGGERTRMLTTYIVQSGRLQEMIAEHDRLTNDVDRKELERIVGDEKEQEKKEDQQYAAVFNFDHYKRAIMQEDYEPASGKLVTVEELEEAKDGKVEYSMMNSEQSGKIDIRGVVPLSRGDVLTVGGENAFERYQRRVENLSSLVEKMTGSPQSLVEKLEELANRSPPPYVSL